MNFAVLVIDNDGEEEYLCDGMGDTPSKFHSRHAAQETVDFIKIGLEGDVQSINVVSYPKKEKATNERKSKCKPSKNA
jgi:hypothetical protein